MRNPRNRLYLAIRRGHLNLELGLFGKYLEADIGYGDEQRRDEMKALERRVMERALRRNPDQDRSFSL